MRQTGRGVIERGDNRNKVILRTLFRSVVTGRIQTGSYTNQEGQKVYTTDVVVEDQEFAESKAASEGQGGFQPAGRPEPSAAAGDGFMNIPDGIDEELPFNQNRR